MSNGREIARIPLGMHIGRRELNEAHAMIGAAPVPEYMSGHMRELRELYVPIESRRHKLGTMLVNLICQEADANNIVLLLHASSFEQADEPMQGMDDDQLVAWYKRFGFIALQELPTGLIMARRAHASEPSPIIRNAVKLALVN